MEEKRMKKFLKTIFVDNIVLTLLSVVIAVVLCLISAVMA